MNVIEEFKRIRDIPYSIPLSENEKDNSCSGKVVELKTTLEAAGYQTQFRVCDFRWSSLPLPKKGYASNP